MSNPNPDSVGAGVPQQNGGGVAVAEAALPDAIIFIPGLYHDADKAKDGHRSQVDARLRSSGRKRDCDVLSRGSQEQEFRGDHKTRIVSLKRKDGDTEQHVADIYQLNYDRALTGDYRERRPLMQALSIALLLLANFGRLFTAITAKSKTAAEKLQVFYAGAIFLLLAAYGLLLLASVATTAWDVATAANPQFAQVVRDTTAQNPQAADAARTSGAQNAQAAASGTTSWTKFRRLLAFVVVFISALGLFTKASLKAFLAETAAHAVPTIDYLDYDKRKGAVMAQLATLLDYMDEKGTKYRKVHVIAYSFGSIVALDSIFPRQGPVAPCFRKVTTLTTIGSPFDFVRTYWPGYFTNRNALDAPKYWLNIFSPLDILGPDYLDVKTKQERGLGLATGGGANRTAPPNTGGIRLSVLRGHFS
jgi:hypothetical protein